ncbi:MAG TPA: hypothetical protein PKD85_11895 [Saprospiraceae bacterium]|nr:hypothetical protein [Saprospiraceae bacterium]
MKPNHSRFYLLITFLLFVVVLLGFGRTFFLRPFFPQPDHLTMETLPAGIFMHGLLMTLWYILLIAQSALVNVKKVQIHMKMGWALAVVAVLLVVFAMPVMTGFAPRLLELGFLNLDNPRAVQFQNTMWTNDLTSIVVYSSMITIGILNRKNIALHRTMMLFGSMAFLAPAAVRMFSWIVPEQVMPAATILFVLFPISVLIHDWIQFKKFPKYAFGGFVILLVVIFATFLLPTTEFWTAVFLNHLK